MKKLLLIAILVVAYFQFAQTHETSSSPASLFSNQSEVAAASDQPIAVAFEQRQSNVQVEGGGTVSRILGDDVNGSRHQRFIVRLANGQTLLLAHNIDLAPRVDGLSEGDRVSFYGEYEWNAKGGVIHWTHHDPAGQHAAGWVRHNGKTYQ
ncbi:MAG TPA: DUF3465 domain-containing protein [Methylophilaceae bacterium]|nr:DUF3465 domain-containing protein [Methylophilaceae bacterium]HQR60763.1 DUF3465 domain-containing protein [Methylophilaceae bacterium]